MCSYIEICPRWTQGIIIDLSVVIWAIGWQEIVNKAVERGMLVDKLQHSQRLGPCLNSKKCSAS
jgi:hypothetical protein